MTRSPLPARRGSARRGTARRGGALALLATAALTGAVLAAPTSYAAPPVAATPASPTTGGTDEGFGKTDRQRLQQAERAGEPRVTLLVAATDGRVADAARQLQGLGGRVEKRDGRVDYLRVSVPTSRADRVPGLSAVDAVDVDGIERLEDPVPRGEGQAAPVAQTAPGRSTPRENPYMPTAETGAVDLAVDGGFDGTGTTIAVIDSGVDLDHPALRRLPDGSRKVVDWYNANAVGSGDGTWVALSSQTYTGAFTASGRTWTAPATGGPYRFGTLSEGAQDLGAAGSEFGADLDRDGVLRETFGVLVDSATKEVLVDLDNDGSFTDQRRMRDYKVAADVGYFGRDRAATRIVERVAFTVQTDKPDHVGIGLSGNHGTHVAGIAAGHSLFGGDMDGAAPGAEVISVRACLASTACTSSGLLEGPLYAARNGADVANISIGGLPALNDGNNARSELYNRIIAEFEMQIFISAGNSGAGLNTVGDPSVSSDALSVASSISDDTWLSNYGAVVPTAEDLHQFSSRGPREDGGFKPQLSAPGSAISSTPRWQSGGPIAGTYALPPGYSMFNGTSMAAPQATGAAALVVGAYKAANGGARPDPADLRTALMSTARFMDAAGALEQGAGVVDAVAAAELLTSGVDIDTVTASVPVSTQLSDQLATPGVGTGIHDREGVDGEYARTYTLTRTTGPAGPRTYDVSWVGDTDTFLSRSTVTLPLDQPVRFPVLVSPDGTGARSAVLRLDDPDTVGVDLQTMNVVIAPEVPDADNGFEVSRSGELAPNETESLFVRVPEGATALRVELDGGGTEAGAGQLRFMRFTPQGTLADTTSSLSCYNPPVSPGGSCAGGTATGRTLLDPAPGVWEVVVDARRTSDSQAAPFTISAKVLDATVAPDPDVIGSAVVGTPVERSYTVTNSGAAFTGRATGSTLASARVQRPTIADQGSQQYLVTVPAGATALSARIGAAEDPGADLDLTLYNCTTGSCVLAAQSAGATAEESVSVANPRAGSWIVLVDGFDVPQGSTAYDYRDVIVAPQYGSLTVTDSDAPRASGSTWTVPATLTAASTPGAGRQLYGTVDVRDTANTLLGRGEVFVREVSGP